MELVHVPGKQLYPTPYWNKKCGYNSDVVFMVLMRITNDNNDYSGTLMRCMGKMMRLYSGGKNFCKKLKETSGLNLFLAISINRANFARFRDRQHLFVLLHFSLSHFCIENFYVYMYYFYNHLVYVTHIYPRIDYTLHLVFLFVFHPLK